MREVSSTSCSSERALNIVEDLVCQLGSERDDELGVMLLVSLNADDVQPDQCLDVVQ